MKFLLRLSLALISTFVLLGERANACSTCSCGDPTLTLAGDEKPFQGRARFFSDLRYRTESLGLSGVSESDLSEGRFSLGGLYAPARWALVGITLPFVSKELTEINGATESTFGLGDIGLMAKVFLFPNQLAGGRHLVGLMGGLQLPTASQKNDSSGSPLIIDVQPGTGAWVPSAGVWYGYYRFPYSVYASGAAFVPTSGWQNFQAGTSVVNSLALQYHITRDWAAQVALDTRWSEKDETAGATDPNSGGFLAYTTPRIIYSPWMDVLFHASIQIPTIDQLNGNHREGFIFMAGVTYDL